MSYDQITSRETYSYTGMAFGAASATKTLNIRGPKGKRGLVRDIEIDITTAMVGTTAVPEILVGVSGTLDKGARFRLGSAAGTGYGTGVKRARPLATQRDATGVKPQLNDFTSHVALESDFLPADTDAIITLKEGDGGTEAGAGNIRVMIDWF